jgi:hypothetical protein
MYLDPRIRIEPSPGSPVWKRSTFCSGGACVEVARMGYGLFAIRRAGDTDRTGWLIFTGDEWAAFLNGARAGEFDPEALTVIE